MVGIDDVQRLIRAAAICSTLTTGHRRRDMALCRLPVGEGAAADRTLIVGEGAAAEPASVAKLSVAKGLAQLA